MKLFGEDLIVNLAIGSIIYILTIMAVNEIISQTSKEKYKKIFIIIYTFLSLFIFNAAQFFLLSVLFVSFVYLLTSFL